MDCDIEDSGEDVVEDVVVVEASREGASRMIASRHVDRSSSLFGRKNILPLLVDLAPRGA